MDGDQLSPSEAIRGQPDDGDSSATASPRKPRRVLTGMTAIAVLPALALGMIVLHEIGHTMVAWAFGDQQATFVIYQRSDASSCFGCNLYHSNHLSSAANAVVNLGGVGATGLAGLAAAVLMRVRRRPRVLPRWLLLEIVVLTWAGDLVFQVIQAATTNIPAREPVGWGIGYVDFDAAVSFASQATAWPHLALVTTGLATVVAWTLVLGVITWRSWISSAQIRT